jgi:hypothetical protein
MAATMQFHFREHWRDLQRGRPGQRFQDRHARMQEEQKRSGPAKRILMIALAIVFLAIGVVLTVIPGPAFVFFILAGAVLAGESKVIARFMDWSEVRARKIIAWARRQWRRMPLGARVLLIATIAGCVAVAAFWGYRLMQA